MTCPDESSHLERGTVCFRLAKSGFYIHELYRIGLWPIPNSNTQKSIKKTSNCLLSFENYTASQPSNFGRRCDIAMIDFKHHLLQATEMTSKRNRGLCLNCVKKGKIMVAEGNCRATSLELCKEFKQA